jgi:arylsulfatase
MTYPARPKLAAFASGLLLIAAVTVPLSAQAQAPAKKPNIVVIMGDDIGMWNIGAYHRGLMAGKTPNLDKIAKEGMLFTDYYAEASCTAGRANFITGELPIRTGMTTVGQAGAKTGIPAEASTIARALKEQGYATGQFGKNHLGDLNEFLPTVHGFDEFFGYLYHLDAMEDPAHPNYPQNLLNVVGPRNMVHSWATETDDATVDPRWGKVGKQKIEAAGTRYPKRMETVDDEIRDLGTPSWTRAKSKPFFVWLNPTRMHIVTHRRNERYAIRRMAGRNKKPAWPSWMTTSVQIIEEAQSDSGRGRQHHRPVHHRQLHRSLLPGPTAVRRRSRGARERCRGRFRVPALLRWPGHTADQCRTMHLPSGLDWYPTFLAAAETRTSPNSC